eukprot:s473_g36.t1
MARSSPCPKGPRRERACCAHNEVPAMAPKLFHVLLALLVLVDGLGHYKRQEENPSALVDSEEAIADQLVKEAEANVERESDTPKESNSTKKLPATPAPPKVPIEANVSKELKESSTSKKEAKEDGDEDLEKEIMDMENETVANKTAKEVRSGGKAASISALAAVVLSAAYLG